MKPIPFKQANTIIAKDQPPYLPLPAHKTEDGHVTSCWQLTWKERFKILVNGKFFFTVWTFNHLLQPQRPHLDFEESTDANR